MKQLVYRFYLSDGTYVSSLKQSDFVGFPEFTIDINGGLSELRLQGAFSFDDWNYPPDGLLTRDTLSIPPEGYTGNVIETKHGVDRIFNAMFIGNLLKIWVTDEDEPEGVQIWSGIYAGIELEYTDNGEKNFIHHFVPNISRLSSRIFRNGTQTTVSYLSRDPSDMFRGAVYNANVGITYTSDTVKDTGVSRTYDFIAEYAIDVLKKAIQLTPNRWIWFVGGDDYLYLRNIDTHGTTHNIPLSSCKTARFQKSIAFLRNRVVFLGGGSPALFQQTDTGGQDSWGIYEEKISDERVTDASTATVLTNRFLADRKGGTNYFQIEIFDNNFSNNGYDIESIKPGDQIVLSTGTGSLDFSVLTWGNFTWGLDQWKYDFYAMAGIPGVVQRITYKFDSAIVECSFTFDQQNQRIEDINRDLTDYRFKDAPVDPTI